MPHVVVSREQGIDDVEQLDGAAVAVTSKLGQLILDLG
jgi:hypothetical protein